MQFSPEEIAMLKSGTCRIAQLLFMDFASEPMWLHDGIGVLNVGGQDYLGHGGLVSIPETPSGPAFFASSINIALSGVPLAQGNFIDKMMQQQAEVRGRRVVVSAAIIDADFRPIGQPFSTWAGIMDTLEWSAEVAKRSIVQRCETPFVSRRRPRYGYFTDEDHQARFPGDRVMRFVSAVTRKITWPTI
jgi:hypothetical protein